MRIGQRDDGEAEPAQSRPNVGARFGVRLLVQGVDVRFRANFAYIAGRLPDGTSLPLMRLRYGGSASVWGFAIYLASKDGYKDSVLPSGDFTGTPKKLSTAPAASTSPTQPPGPDELTTLTT